MQSKSLGLIETKGFAVGIEAADAALKAANVELLGYELCKGGGWTTIKLQGEVGAIKAAVDAARSVAMRTDSLVSAYVIARPSNETEKMVRTFDTQLTEVSPQMNELQEDPSPVDDLESAKPTAVPTAISRTEEAVAVPEERDISSGDDLVLSAGSEALSESLTESDAAPEALGKTALPEMTEGPEEQVTKAQPQNVSKPNNSGKPGKRKRT